MKPGKFVNVHIKCWLQKLITLYQNVLWNMFDLECAEKGACSEYLRPTRRNPPPPPNVAPTADTWDKLLKGNCFWRVITVGSGVSGPYQEGWFLWTTGDMGHPISSPDELADFTGFSSVLAVYWVTSDVNLVWYPPTRLCYGETRTLLVVSLIWLFVGIRPPAPIGNNLIAANWLTHRRKSIRLMVIAWRRCRGPWSIANRFTWIWSGF